MDRDNKDLRKPRIRNNTMTQKLLKNVGLEEVEKTWIRLGMYKGAEELSKLMQEYVSFSTLRYMSQKYDWKRPVNKLSPIYKGVMAGTVPAAYYKHLIFEEENKNVWIWNSTVLN